MNLPGWLQSGLDRVLRREDVAAEMDEEQRAHIALRADDLERRGMSRGEAERRARVEFGARERIKEENYRALGGNFLDVLAGDVVYALRVLRKSRGFVAAAVLTLAMAIGANAVVFSVLNGMILKPLQVPDPGSLYVLEHGSAKDTNLSYPDYVDLRARNHSFTDLAAFTIPQSTLNTGSGPEATWGVEASGNYFDSLGIRPYLGRFFHEADEHGPNSAPYLVLSFAYWHTHYHEDPGVVGRVLQLNEHPFTIIGVAPQSFRGTLVFYSPSFFVPIVNEVQVDGENGLENRGSRGLIGVIGNLKPGVTPAEAVADLNGIGAYLERTYPKDEARMSFALGSPGLLGDAAGGPIKAFIAGLMLLAILILLAACANLGSLFAARAADRAKEVALRLALGSNRQRVLRGLFTEALLVSLAGGMLGMLISVLLLRWLSVWQPFGNFPVHTPVTPDAKVYALSLALTVLSGFLFGAVPVGQVMRTSPYEVVKTGSTARKGRRLNARDLLLAAQISLCAVLVTSSLVAVRGMMRTLHDHFGFNPEHSLLLEIDMHMAGYTGARAAAFEQRVLNAVDAVPGVTAAGWSDPLPLSDTDIANVYRDDTRDLTSAHAAARAYQFRVSPDYLRADGTTLLAGRSLNLLDDKQAPRVAVVSRQFARILFGGEKQAIGQHFRTQDGTRVEVVGIVEDGKYETLGEEAQAAMFLPILQFPSGARFLVVRSSLEEGVLGPELRNVVRQLDPDLPINFEKRYDEMTMVFFGPQMATIVLGIMGVMGAMLSITGIFGLAAYTVSKRLRELGIRVALGARRREVLGTALGRSVRLLAWGSAAGLALGLLATRVLALVVYRATPSDPVVLAGVVAAMALLGLVATWIPAQRALRVDPMQLLREE
jgi:predicted permease